jgi:hypothetical protein
MLYGPINEDGQYLTEVDLHVSMINGIKRNIDRYAMLKKHHNKLDKSIEYAKGDLSENEYKELKRYLKNAISKYNGGYNNIFEYIGKSISDNIKKYRENKERDQEHKKQQEANKKFIADYNVDEVAKTIKFKQATSSDLDSLYDSDAYCIEGYDLSELSPNLIIEEFINNNNEYIKPNTIIYIADGKTVNKHYDLEGENSYKPNFHFTIISLNSVVTTDGKYPNKYGVKARWWRDVVDNNEYREYMKGRHKYTPRIQWLIDAYNKD